MEYQHMSALDASQDREGHEIDSGGRSESDDEFDQDSVAEPGLTRLNLMGRHEAYASPAQQRIANLMPLGGLAQVGSTGRLGVAAFIPGDQPAPYDITARGYGPSGPGLAKYLARQAIVWHELGRPGAQDLELSAWPPGARPETIGGASIVIDRPHVRLAVRWPTL